MVTVLEQDTPRLLAAIEAVLGRADSYERAANRASFTSPGVHAAYRRCAEELRTAISGALLGQDQQRGEEPGPVPCPRCEGCGQLADTDEREPWTAWTSLPVRSSAAVLLGIVRPVPCDECNGTGSVPGEEPADGKAREVPADGR